MKLHLQCQQWNSNIQLNKISQTNSLNIRCRRLSVGWDASTWRNTTTSNENDPVVEAASMDAIKDKTKTIVNIQRPKNTLNITLEAN